MQKMFLKYNLLLHTKTFERLNANELDNKITPDLLTKVITKVITLSNMNQLVQ